jgi:predicted O-methyltransferase YrrM
MFTVDWFEKTGKKNFEKHLKCFSGKENIQFLEIGVYEGMSTVWLLQNVITANSSTVDVVDTFLGSIEHKGRQELKLDTLKERFLENIKLYKQHVNIHVGRSQDVLRNFQKKFDFIYVDGSHQAIDVIEDAILAFRLLKINGLMAFDDYRWNKIGDPLQHPQIAIDAFIQLFSNKIEVVEKNYQLFIKKIGN